MNTRDIETDLTLSGRIEKRVHSVSDLSERVSDYESLSTEEKLELSRTVEPKSTETVYNVTTNRLHRYFVDNLNPEDTSNTANLSTEWLALGTNGGGGTSTSDTDLNSRAFEKSITDTADVDDTLLTSTFIESSEGNGNTYDELGLYTGNPANLANSDVFLINHATFTSVTKNNDETITFDVKLTFSDV